MDRHSIAACSGDSDCSNSRRDRGGDQQQQFFGGPSLRLQRRAAVFKARRRCNAWLESDMSNEDDEEEDDEDGDQESPASPPPKPLVREKKLASRIATISNGKATEDDRPINFMEVYHRLKLGDLSCQPALSRQNYSYYWAKQLQATVGANESMAALDMAAAAAGQDAQADETGSAGNSDLRQLQRLLRDRDRVGGTPPPVPKPRKSAVAAASSRPAPLQQQQQQQQPNPLASRRRHHPAPHESTYGPFASVTVSTAEPFEPPRHCRVLSERIASSSTAASAGGPQQTVCYHCTDWELLRRLSITGRLLARDRGRAPTRWLSSAALLSHLRYPTCYEIASRLSVRSPLSSPGSAPAASGESAPPAVATQTVVKWPAPNDPARAAEPQLVGFAFKAMDRRRLRSRSGEALLRRRRRKSLSNLYAVPVS